MDVGRSSRFTFKIKGVEDTLRVTQFQGEESISRPYVFTIDIACENFNLDFDAILQQPAQLVIDDPEETRYFNGIIHEMQINDPTGRFCRYRFELTAKVSLLIYRTNLKIFQNLTADAIIRQVLENAGLTTNDFRFQITAELPTRIYCTQYQETDLDFIHRLMAEDGLHYFFEQTHDKCVMVISDSHYSFKPVPITPTLQYQRQSGQVITDYFINELYIRAEAKPNTVVYRDYNFERPRQDLEVKETTGEGNLTVYQHNISYQTLAAGKQKAENTLKAYQNVKVTGSGESNSPFVSAGHFFKLENYDDSRFDHHWLVTGVRHRGMQPQVLEEYTGSRGSGYANQFTATPRDHIFKTQPLTPKPKIRGSQTAFVTGPEGEEIYCDQYGRVKIQFHWDRDGKYDENSSCWVRVKQPLAGKKWGDLFTPRIGTEVLIKFINGDPDQPIIMGALYNGRDKPPYKLPDHKTRTTLKTNSTPGGDGFNEIRFEDKKGSEQLFIHAQKDLDLQVKNDKRENIGNERHLIVGNNSYEHVKGNYHQKIDGNQYINIDQDCHTTIGDSLHGKTGGKYLVQAGNEIHIKAGDKVVIDAGVEITLKGGGSFAKLDPSGVAFQGATIKLNEGGSAGSGSGVSIQEPFQAAKADNNEPGQKLEAIPPQAANIAKQLVFGQLNINGEPANNTNTKTIELLLEDENNTPIPLVGYEVTFEDGSKRQGTLDHNGQVKIENVPEGHFTVVYPDQEDARNKGLAVKINQAINNNDISQVRGILSQPSLQAQGVANAYQLLFGDELPNAVKTATTNTEEELFISHLLSRSKLSGEESAELMPWQETTGSNDE